MSQNYCPIIVLTIKSLKRGKYYHSFGYIYLPSDSMQVLTLSGIPSKKNLAVELPRQIRAAFSGPKRYPQRFSIGFKSGEFPGH